MFKYPPTKKLFQDAKKRRIAATEKRQVAILIDNFDYKVLSGMDPLPGVEEDLEKLTAFFGDSYDIYPIVNAEDILEEIDKLMEALPDRCRPVTHFQLVYSGINCNQVSHVFRY